MLVISFQTDVQEMKHTHAVIEIRTRGFNAGIAPEAKSLKSSASIFEECG
jgi:hypothetical protein